MGAATPPPRPSSFFGTVTAGGNAAPAGTAVSAWIGGVRYAEATVFVAEGTSVYRLDVPGDLPGTAAVEGGLPGQAVVFKVGSAQISRTAVWQDGAVVRLDITAPLGPDVSVSVDDGVAQAAPDDTLTYTINVINPGPGTATGVTVRDTLWRRSRTWPPRSTTAARESIASRTTTRTRTWMRSTRRPTSR